MHLYVAFVLLAHIYIFPIYFYTISVSGDYLSINNSDGGFVMVYCSPFVKLALSLHKQGR